MKNITLRKNINVDKPNLIPIFNLKEDDDAIIKLALFKNSIEFDVTGQTLRLGAKTSKGLIEQLDGFTIDKNNIDIQLKNSILIPGVIEIDLEIKDAKGAMTTASFFITVNQKVLNDTAVEATNEFDTFTKTVEKIEEDYNSLKGGLLAEDKVVYFQDEINKTNSQLEQSVKFKVVGEGTEVPPISSVGGSYTHPTTPPASMITGLHNVATTGDYNTLINKPTKLSQFTNDLNLSNDQTSNITISNTLENYDGETLNDKMVNMFNDINNNHKNTPMTITLPNGIIEITTDLRAIGWTNKTFVSNGYLYFKNCNAIEFVQCMHNDIKIHASSSAKIDASSGNTIGLINPTSVASLTKRGYKITDCSYNRFEFNNIIGFTNGIEIYSEYGAKGSFYNNIYFTAIWRCQRPMWFRTGKASDDTSAQSGWITEIYVHGGMFDCDDGVLIGQEVENRPANEPSDNYQGLKFYNIGVEHVRKKENGRGIYFLQGKNNAVINPRFEGSLGGGNSTSGAYILVEESGYACNNRIETSNYPINVDRVKLNYLAKQLANPNYDNPAGSYIEGDLYDTTGFKCGYKAIATAGKMVYEAKNLSNYYLQNAKPNTFNYTYSSTEFAKVKTEDGTIKTIGYTS